jgi:hypothetical protein
MVTTLPKFNLCYPFVSPLPLFIPPHDAAVEWHWRENGRTRGRKAVPVTLFPIHIPLVLTWARTRASTVRSRQLTTRPEPHPTTSRQSTASHPGGPVSRPGGSSCGICSGQRGIGTGFLRVFRLSAVTIIPLLLHVYSCISLGRDNGPVGGRSSTHPVTIMKRNTWIFSNALT